MKIQKKTYAVAVAAVLLLPGVGACGNDNHPDVGTEVVDSSVGVQPTITDDATTRGVGEFWATTDMVPTAEAGWFTELVTQAKAAPKVKVG